MQRFSLSILKPFLQRNNTFNFGKILKLTPKINQTSQSQPIKSIFIKGRQLLAKYLYQKDSLKNLKEKDEQFVCNQFFEFIKSINLAKFEQRTVKLTGEQAAETLKHLRNLNFINQWIDHLISRKKPYNQEERTYVTKFFSIICLIFRRAIYQKSTRKDFDFTFLKNFMALLNQYFMILELDHKLVFNYMFLTNYCTKTKNIDQNRTYFINLKFVVDFILDAKPFLINHSFLYELINYVTLSTLVLHYPARVDELLKFILNKLESDWYRQTFYTQRMPSAFKYLGDLRYKNTKILQGCLQLMRTQITLQNFVNISGALACYINLMSQIYVDRQVPSAVTSCLKNMVQFLIKDKVENKMAKNQLLRIHKNYFQFLIPSLYRASIWQQDIWLFYLDWLAIERNYQQVQIIHIFTIFDLATIDRDIIPEKILDAIQKTKKKLLLVNNFRIEDINLQKLYYGKYSQRARTNFYSIQKNIANNLRSVSGTIIKAEVLIHFFLVDILMNDKIVIQINSPLHYNIDQKNGQKLTNIKSAFRKRIIQKLGYQFMEFQIDQFTQGNVEFLKTVRELCKNN